MKERLKNNDKKQTITSAGKMLHLLTGREDIFSRESIDYNNRRKVENDLRPLTENIMKDHLMGKLTIDTFVQRPNATVRFTVIDLDISKRILLQIDQKSEEYKVYLKKALDIAIGIRKILSQMGITCYVEYSGSRGHHVWILYTEWVPTRYANMLCDIIERKMAKDEDISVEFFPNKTKIKAVKTSYLTHFERLTVLYVFGHLGDEGREFVHKVMSFTLNYKYNVTENFIRKMPEKPVSCVKLRDQYKRLTAEFGCSCIFKRSKNCYPSPVLHAISLADDLQSDITLPTSRSLTKEKENKVKAEMNVHTKADDLATRLLDMRKQKRALDKNIRKIEKELGEIFDIQKIDCLEIEMGMLTRRKNGESYEWFIEI